MKKLTLDIKEGRVASSRLLTEEGKDLLKEIPVRNIKLDLEPMEPILMRLYLDSLSVEVAPGDTTVYMKVGDRLEEIESVTTRSGTLINFRDILEKSK